MIRNIAVALYSLTIACGWAAYLLIAGQASP